MNNGVKMPMAGIGVFTFTPAEAQAAIGSALHDGVRLIGTANAYMNEKATDRAIKASGVKRGEIFLVSKLWPSVYEDENAVDDMLKRLDTDYVEPWFETMRPVVKNLTKYAGIVCWNLGDPYATGTQFIEPTNFYSSQLFAENGFRPIWIRIWKKQGQNFGVGPYHLVTNKPVQQYEYISAFSRNGDVEYNDQEYVWLSAYAGHAYRFVKRLTKEERKKWGYAGIWEMTTVRANKEHPAMFPVELPWRCIKMHSDMRAFSVICPGPTVLPAARSISLNES